MYTEISDDHRKVVFCVQKRSDALCHASEVGGAFLYSPRFANLSCRRWAFASYLSNRSTIRQCEFQIASDRSLLRSKEAAMLFCLNVMPRHKYPL